MHEHGTSTQEIVLQFDRAPDVHRFLVVHAEHSRARLFPGGPLPRGPVPVPDRAPFADLVARISSEMTTLDGALAVEGLMLELIARLIRDGLWPRG